MVGDICWYINENNEYQECKVIKYFKNSYSDIELDNLEEDDCKILVWVEFTKPNVCGQLEHKKVCKEKLFTEDQILKQLWK